MERFNLLKETMHYLSQHDKSVTDVLWVGTTSVWFTWDEFASIADVEYDSGFGGPEVAVDLLIVGDGWWLERGEYDGSEWWKYREIIEQPALHFVPQALTEGQRLGNGWQDTFASLQGWNTNVPMEDIKNRGNSNGVRK